MIAAQKGQKEVVECIMGFHYQGDEARIKRKMSGRDIRGNTALHLAYIHHYLDIAEILTQHGVGTLKRNMRGMLAEEIALKRSDFMLTH